LAAKLRCGVVGLGRGKTFVRIFAARSDCEVVAVCDPNPTALAGFSGLKAHTNYDAFLEERLDVVAVISPGPVHAEQSVKALERGAHVLCETPCVYSLDEARAVIAAVEKSGRKYMLAENYIWQGWCVRLKEMARAGKLGNIVYAEGDYTHDCRDLMLADEAGFVNYAERDRHPGAKPTWRATHLSPLFYCSHTLGPLLHVMEDRVATALAFAVAGRAAPDLAPTDLETGLFETRRGAIIRLTNGFTVAHPMALYYHLVGTRGSAVVLRAGTTCAKWWSEAGEAVKGWQEVPPDFFQRPDGRSDLEAMIGDFVASIRQDTEPPLDVYESLAMTIPGIIAHESGMRGGAKLSVPDLRSSR